MGKLPDLEKAKKIESNGLGSYIEAAQAGDREACSYLEKEYGPIAGSLTKTYIRKFGFLPGYNLGDMIQEALIGGIEAVRDFDPFKSDNFHTFAALCINRALKRVYRFEKRDRKMALNEALSLDGVSSNGEGNGEEKSGYGVLSSSSPEYSPEKAYEESYALKEMTELITEISGLSALERDVLYMKLNGCSNSEIMSILGYDTNSRELAKKLENAIFRVKRKAQNNPAVRDFFGLSEAA